MTYKITSCTAIENPVPIIEDMGCNFLVAGKGNLVNTIVFKSNLTRFTRAVFVHQWDINEWYAI